MTAATIIFDYDRTLSPGESVVDVVGMAIDDHPRRTELARDFQSLQARWRRGEKGLKDLAAVLRLTKAIRKRHIDAYVATRREPPEDLRHLFAELRGRGVRLHIVSSGYRDWLAPIGRAWGFSDFEIHARHHLSWFGGRAHPVNSNHLLRPRSKARIIRALVGAGDAGHPMLIVGDGAEDFDAAQSVGADGFLLAEYYLPASEPRLAMQAADNRIRVGVREKLIEAIRSAMSASKF